MRNVSSLPFKNFMPKSTVLCGFPKVKKCKLDFKIEPVNFIKAMKILGD